MATFYVLPSRYVLGRQVGELLGTLFPGLHWPSASWPDLAELLGSTALSHHDVYVVFREDLPEAEATEAALAETCGAEPGDEVVVVSTGARLHGVTAERWLLNGATLALPCATR